MNPPQPGSLAAILDALGHGLPMLIVQVVACAVLLAVGVAIYIRLTPFHEGEMVAGGNAAAGTMTLGVVALGMRNFRGMIEGGNVAAAITLAGAQIAVALLNAAAMVPN
jgi:putative membrane protein